jgi:hypothetical protein
MTFEEALGEDGSSAQAISHPRSCSRGKAQRTP